MAHSTDASTASKTLAEASRQCRVCDQPFRPRTRRQMSCSKACSIAWSNNQKSAHGAGQKQCRACQQVKDFKTDFRISARLCLECESLKEQGAKKCSTCGEVKAQTEFYLRTNRATSIFHVCKDCASTASREYHARDYVRVRARYRKLAEKYGLTAEQYEQMLTEQNGSCKICKRAAADLGKNLVVDHCHQTGRVRGLLCAPCNSAIGYFDENPQRMINAITYLE